MDHAEALTRLADAAATPLGLERLEADTSAEGVALRAHLQGCADCYAELMAWRMTSVALLGATPETVRAPAEARDRILAAVARDGVPRGAAAATGIPLATPAPVVPIALHQDDLPRIPLAHQHAAVVERNGPVRFRRLALAAAAVLIIFVAGAVLGPILGLTPKDRGVLALVAAVQASDQILQQPGHREAVLTRSDGTRAGTVLVNPATGDIVVLSSDLDGDSGGDYHCSLVRDGAAAAWIGPMLKQNGTSYWAGKVTSYPDLGKPGDIIQVVVGTSRPELTATF
jgi:hypothetical protein